MKKPTPPPPCYQTRYVSGPCMLCGTDMQPAHYQVVYERLTCAPEPKPERK